MPFFAIPEFASLFVLDPQLYLSSSHINNRNDFPTLPHKKIHSTILMATSIGSAQRLTQDQLKQMLPELKGLPDGWKIKVGDDLVVYYEGPDGKPHRNHPTFGPLPDGWSIRLCEDPPKCGKRSARYYYSKEKTKTYSKRNPRLDRKLFHKQNESRKNGDMEIAGHLVRTRKNLCISQMSRQEIGNTNIRHKFHILKVLDDGGGSVGGMNGGVFVVKEKNAKPPEQLMVDKRFKFGSALWKQMAKEEIQMLHRVQHSAISFYLAAFVTPEGPASVYVEFCDRGSLENLIKAYAEKRHAEPKADKKPEVPERFIWHAFSVLCDAFAYLATGHSYIGEGKDLTKGQKWIPILHRDMKPDNVLLRSRATPGTRRYFYCVLSDFGLACEDWPQGHKNQNEAQASGSALGTSCYYAPELLHDPYPKTEIQVKRFPNGHRHTAKSDLYALGLVMYNLADCNPCIQTNGAVIFMAGQHIEWRTFPKDQNRNQFMGKFLAGTISRRDDHNYDISMVKLNKPYSKELSAAVKMATRKDLEERPDPVQMMKILKHSMKKSRFTEQVPKGAVHEELPDWATRVHDYHSRPPIMDPKYNN